MGPNDPKIEYPLRPVFYHKELTIRDAKNREIFKMDVIRPSIEAWDGLQKWGERICELLNERALEAQSK